MPRDDSMTGMIMSAMEFAQLHPEPTEAEARAWLVGNICGCTGYQNIIASMLAGAGAMRAHAKGA